MTQTGPVSSQQPLGEPGDKALLLQPGFFPAQFHLHQPAAWERLLSELTPLSSVWFCIPQVPRDFVASGKHSLLGAWGSDMAWPGPLGHSAYHQYPTPSPLTEHCLAAVRPPLTQPTSATVCHGHTRIMQQNTSCRINQLGGKCRMYPHFINKDTEAHRRDDVPTARAQTSRLPGRIYCVTGPPSSSTRKPLHLSSPPLLA